MVTKDQFKEDKTLKKESFYLSSYVQKKVCYIYICMCQNSYKNPWMYWWLCNGGKDQKKPPPVSRVN